MPTGVYKRKPFTEEHKNNMRKVKIGNTFALGFKHTEEAKGKIREASKGNTNTLGYKHTQEAKLKIGKASSNRSEEIRQKTSNTMVGKMPVNNQEPGTFNNIKRGWYTILDKKMFFRSKWEANYALYLNLLIEQKQIVKWEFEPDVFVFEKIKFGTRSYRPDFKVFNTDGTIEYHEVKGYMDARSKTKIKRMAKYYPKIKLVIIDSPTYREIRRKLGKILKFYE